jgi:hypothetical protein
MQTDRRERAASGSVVPHGGEATPKGKRPEKTLSFFQFIVKIFFLAACMLVRGLHEKPRESVDDPQHNKDDNDLPEPGGLFLSQEHGREYL